MRALVELLLAATPCAVAQSPQQAGAAERDYVAGRRLLDAAIRATGDSTALARLGTITTSFCARAVEVGQSARPDAPYDTIHAAGRRIYDLAKDRYAQDWATEFRGGLPLALHEVVTDSAAYSTDLRGGVHFAVAEGGLPVSRRRVEDNAPYAPLMILDRARRNATSVRIVHGASRTQGGDGLLFVDRGTVTTLGFDARSHLLVSMEALFDNWAVGLAPLRIEFHDYRPMGTVQLATRVTTWFQHRLLTDVTFPDLTRSAAPADAFAPPRDSVHAVPIGGPLLITIDTVAPHVFAIHYGQTAGPNFGYNPPFAYAQLLVELRDRLLLVDAPWSSTVQQAVIDKVRSLFPEKPIGLVTFTHYHSDHFGGLRPYLASGITVITTPGNRDFIERVVAVSHPSDPQGPSGQSRLAPHVETFTRTHSIPDTDAPVELREIGGGHADEMVIAYLPRQRVLFATDVFGIFPVRGGAGGWYEAERALARYVLGQGWAVNTVVSGHGAISGGTALDSVLAPGPRGSTVSASSPQIPEVTCS